MTIETHIPTESSLEVEVEIVRTETVKPPFPTADSLGRFCLSVFDQFTPDVYTPIVFFYAGGADNFDRLKVSLSETLGRFYPVAGRVDKEGLYVDCDDRGADFVETKVHGCRLSDILGRPDDNVLSKLLPCSARDGGSGRLLRVQANAFGCGGVAVGVCLSHLIADACAMSAFIKEWAAVARGDSERPPTPDLNLIASRFPAIPIAKTAVAPLEISEVIACGTRRYLFDGGKIAHLRDIATGESGERPTRVAAASAFTWKCIVNSKPKSVQDQTKPSFVAQPVNVRRRVEPPLAADSLGNMVMSVFVEAGDRNESINDLPLLAAKFRLGLRDATKRYATELRDSEGARAEILENVKIYGTLFGRECIDFYIMTSWCRYGWYEADFGWGKPEWISTVNSDVKNVVMMMDTRDGDGIEAWITLPEPHMTVFETNSEFLRFASLNPAICLS